MTIAAASFLEHGYASTTMSSIAATLGGSKGTLWSYFPSKEGLFEAVIDHATSAYRAHLSEVLDPCGDLAATLRHFCSGIMDKVLSADAIALYRLTVAEAGRFPEMGRIFYNRAPRRTWEMLGAFLSGAMDRGLMRRTDPLEAAQLLATLCTAFCQQQLLFGVTDTIPPAAIERDIDRALTIFLGAYGLEEAL